MVLPLLGTAVCEQKFIGSYGCCGRDNQRVRSGIVTVLLLLNLYAMPLTVFSSFAASDNMSILEHVNFAEGVAFFEQSQAIVTVRAYVGLDYIGVNERNERNILAEHDDLTWWTALTVGHGLTTFEKLP